MHATPEPVQTLHAGWGMATIGEGESPFASTKAKHRPLGDFPGFTLEWDRCNALGLLRSVLGDAGGMGV